MYDIDQVLSIIQRVHDTERMDFGASSTRDHRNAQWARLIGIIHHGSREYDVVPDPRWCIKSAGNGRPQSDDVVVFAPTRDYWDCIPNAGLDTYFFRANYDGKLPAEQLVYAPPVPVDSVLPPTQPTPYWQAEHSALLAQLQAKFDPATQIGDRAYIKICAEQFAYSFPQEGWGRKSVDPTRPISDHSIARQTTTGLIGFRIVPDIGVPKPDDIRGQFFVAASPVNHLGVPVTPPPPVDPPVTPPETPWIGGAELAAMLSQRLSALDASVLAARLSVQQVGEAVRGTGELLIDRAEQQQYRIRAAVNLRGILNGDITPVPLPPPNTEG